MKHIFILCLLIVLCPACATTQIVGHMQDYLIRDTEHQAQAAAYHGMNTLASRVINRTCIVTKEPPPPTIIYQDQSFVNLACVKQDLQELPVPPKPAGCFIQNGNIIVVVKGTLNSRYKILVHEYMHYYYYHSKLEPLCKEEMAVELMTEQVLNSLLLYRPGL